MEGVNKWYNLYCSEWQLLTFNLISYVYFPTDLYDMKSARVSHVSEHSKKKGFHQIWFVCPQLSELAVVFSLKSPHLVINVRTGSSSSNCKLHVNAFFSQLSKICYSLTILLFLDEAPTTRWPENPRTSRSSIGVRLVSRTLSAVLDGLGMPSITLSTILVKKS